MGFIEHFKKRGLKDVFNFKKLKVFLEAKSDNVVGITIAAADAVSYAEQVVYRTLKCPECVIRGSCIGCGCPTAELMRTPKGHCGLKDKDGNDTPKWENMMTTEEWEQLKTDLNFEFSIKFKD